MSEVNLPPNLKILYQKLSELATDISQLQIEVKEIKNNNYLTPECRGLMKHQAYELVPKISDETKSVFWEGYWSPSYRRVG
jgi:hypothetical protein